MWRKFKIKVLNYAMKHLWNALTEDDVLIVYQGNVIIAGEVVGKEIKTEIVSGAKAMMVLPFWKLLRRELKITANRKIYLEGENTDKIIFGKAALWVIELIDKKVENLSRLQ